MIERLKAPIRRRWPRLRLRTILLATFVFVAALPGFGALFLRVYENTLVRQTEAELVAEGAALAAATAADWPGTRPTPGEAGPRYRPEPLKVDLRGSSVLPERPAPVPVAGVPDPAAVAAAAAIAPVIRATTRTTLASALLLDRTGRVVAGIHPGLSYAALPEVQAALDGSPATVLRRNADFAPRWFRDWLSRAADLRIHHARPVVVGGRAVAVLLLSRAPPALYLGLWADAGKIAFGIGVILLTLVVLSGLLSRGISRPIEALGAATRAVTRGEGQVPPPPTTAAIEIQALYADFAHMADAIERRSRYLRDFAHAVSHEFKTPLAGITGAIELLQEHGAAMSDEERRRFLVNAGADAGRLTLLVTRLLELARADMVRSEAGTSTDLLPCLCRVADAFRGEHFNVVVEQAADLPAVAVPAATIERVLASLLDNSRQAGAATASVAVSSSARQVIITLQDNGPGIPPADRDRVFEPFFTSRRSEGGSGLGLPIARSLIQACHGELVLVPSDEGALVEIRVPAS